MPKTYEQLLKDQTSHIKPPTITIDISNLMEGEIEEETTINDDNSSNASGVTEGPEVVEEQEPTESESECQIEFFGVNEGYAVSGNRSLPKNIIKPTIILFQNYYIRLARVILIWRDRLHVSFYRIFSRLFRVSGVGGVHWKWI